METKDRLMHLELPLYKLYYLDSLEGLTFSADEAQQVIDHYGAERAQQMLDAMEWAQQTPVEEWAEALPNTPHETAEVLHYLQLVSQGLKAAFARA